ncbi:hypothetical protein LzC2_27750 [Planctomycetes bacterium LzC2]|uniref:3-keto-alpha-glucoside-1,2-lyase/3-keto-2-hydroxy-glucal hydratase domain-containing protein n=1 Tax=Alienimonas chondri TaxID=2681879 RepID=A0ABX1VFP1_9PLAN|nr:hypothetical protein [Alienimonas chondri]
MDPAAGVFRAAGVGNTELFSADRFDDFELTFEWRLPPGGPVSGNGGGVVVRAEGWNALGLDPRGVEVDLLSEADRDGRRYGTGCLALYDTPVDVPADRRTRRHVYRTADVPRRGPHAWNAARIVCDGDALTVAINGAVVNRAAGLPRRAAPIVLRSQRTAIEYRDVAVRPLPRSN